MNIPSSTYRIQFHKDFTFRHLENIVDYLHDLGITTIYAAPIVQATPGSMHGYDVVDPHSINNEIGTMAELRSLAKKLRNKGMSWIQDIVPNHMAFNTLNFRLMDVLERREYSPYYRYFDIDWEHPSPTLHGKVQVPFLGDVVEACVNRKEITVSFSEKGFTFMYFTTSYPLSVSSFEYLFSLSGAPEFDWKNFATMAQSGTGYTDWTNDKEYYLASIVNNDTHHLTMLEFLERINNEPETLMELLKRQYYSLAYWKDTEKEISYRRFFTVNELICLRMEDAFVFDEYHTFLHTLYRENIIQGIRIDHIDGLKDPSGYISRLRELFGEECYIIAEKILESKEDIPHYWPLQGTSGYEFLAYTNQLLTNRKGAKELLSFYKELMPQLPAYKELVWQNKRLILERYMAGEWENLFRLLKQSEFPDSLDQHRLKNALGAFMTGLPVYRIYPDKFPLSGSDISIFNHAFDKAVAHHPELKHELDYLKGRFCDKAENGETSSMLSFLQRLMQFTGPLTAKGVEDTTFYVYNALVSHDEVGDSPYTLGMSISAFHQTMADRQKLTPLSLNATSTHDTKRGEDARLRLNALCEFPEEWKNNVQRWREINRKFYLRISTGTMVPSLNDEYYIYQAIAGGYPEEGVSEEWRERLFAYYTKVLREAKVHSDWAEPNAEYEKACHSFIRSILKPGSEFLESFEPFVRKLTARANFYALAQVLIKVTAPGIPDIYQGCEWWDLSFVDPDNRRPVDYQKRMTMLSDLEQKEEQGQAVLFSHLEDFRLMGIEKMFVTQKSLCFRKNNNRLFTEGAYIPLQITGKESIAIAFARKLEEQWILVVIPLSFRSGKDQDPAEVSGVDEIVLPESSPEYWVNIFTGDRVKSNGRISLAEILSRFPVAFLRSE